MHKREDEREGHMNGFAISSTATRWEILTLLIIEVGPWSTINVVRNGRNSPLANFSRTGGRINTPGQRYREVKWRAERNTPSNS